MEVTRTASTSHGLPTQPQLSINHRGLGESQRRTPSFRSRKPDIITPSSPSKAKRPYQRPLTESVRKEEEAQRQAALLSFAEARAKVLSIHSYPDSKDADFKYPPGSQGDSSARGLLEQIKNRIDQRAPKPSNFLQKAKQVQQSLLEKQQQLEKLQKAQEEAEKRDSLRSDGFMKRQSQSKTKSEATQGAFFRAKARAADPDALKSAEEAEALEEHYSSEGIVHRDDDLALVEALRPGPRAIPPNPEDPKWEYMEPFSGHRLRERKLSHVQLKDYLCGRYHVPPSLLYSIARPLTMGMDGRLPDTMRNGDYEVPVDGDWIVIATIVEKSDLLVTKGFRPDDFDLPNKPSSRGTAAMSRLEDDPVLFRDVGSDANGKLRLDLEAGNSNAFQDASRGKSKSWQRSQAQGEAIDEELERTRQQINLAHRSRKFVILKLVDLGVNSTQGDGSGSAGRGDNYLSLVAYESDQVDTSVVMHNSSARSEVPEPLSSASSVTRKFINGSRGAFELLYKQAEGTLIAIMNPKVMRPWAPAGSNANSTETKMLRITPRSADDCLIIGQAADYRRCSAIKANGQRCSSFVDIKARKQTRTTTCDYHLSRHMDELAKGRPEFAANATSRFGGAGGAAGMGGRSAHRSSFPGRRGGGYKHDGSAISNINSCSRDHSDHSSFSSSNQSPPSAHARKLKTAFGNIGDGMENNGGQVYLCQSPIVTAYGAEQEVRASDPSNWKYDVSGRYGRGNTEKQSRLKKQIAEEQLMRKIEARFAAPSERPSKRQSDDTDGEKSEVSALPVLPNGTADMINAAYSTLDHRKRVAKQKQDAVNAKRRKYTGVVDPAVSQADTEAGSAKLKFMNLASTSSKRSNTLLGGMPIVGLNRHAADSQASPRETSNSRSKLLSLARDAALFASTSRISGLPEPNLKLNKAHRPKLRLPSHEVGRASKLKVVGGELVNLDDFQDDWEDDLDLPVASTDNAGEKARAAGEAGLSDRIILPAISQPRQSHMASQQDDADDSDLEII